MTGIDGVRLKLERARFHLNNVDELTAPLVNACREAVVGRAEQEGREYVYRITDVPTVDPLIGIVLGDALHNLRSSLDHLAWQLILASGGTSGKPLGSRSSRRGDVGRLHAAGTG